MRDAGVTTGKLRSKSAGLTELLLTISVAVALLRYLGYCLRDPTFSRFGTVPVCDSAMDRHTVTMIA